MKIKVATTPVLSLLLENMEEPQSDSSAEENANVSNEAALVEDPRMENHSLNSNLQEDSNSNESNTRSVIRKKRVQRISDSDSDTPPKSNQNDVASDSNSSDSEDQNVITNTKPTRLKKLIDSESDLESNDTDKPSNSVKIEESRTMSKKSMLKRKFNKFTGRKSKGVVMESAKPLDSNHEVSSNSSSEDSDGDETSVGKIKHLIKEPNHFKSNLCDPDTSDEESSINIKQKKGKTMKPTSPKPMRMSAKEAMENMHKIKSESNRMLREKEVSLPYHRPKALSLKDIMSRRKPALTRDGKALPIKMNEQQLKQYALQLEQRQKEIMELCKSESENEEDNTQAHNPEQISINNDSIYDEISQANGDRSKSPDKEQNKSNLAKEVAVDTTIVANIADKDNTPAKEVNTVIADNTEIESNSNTTEVEKVLEETEQQKPDKQMDTSTGDLGGGNESAELKLQYNDSIEKEDGIQTVDDLEDKEDNLENKQESGDDLENMQENLHLPNNGDGNTEVDSQLISLHYDTEKYDVDIEINKAAVAIISDAKTTHEVEDMEVIEAPDFSDDEINMADIDSMIENAEIIRDCNDTAVDSPMLIREQALKAKPKLSGAPGMVIDLDGADPLAPKKLSGIELLKERFTYFAKLKTTEEVRREAERRIKPGTQLKKLKQDLEDQMSEQRSLEWAKRLEEEKQLRDEMDAMRGETSDVEDDIDEITVKSKIEEEEGGKKKEGKEDEKEVEDNESEEESCEDIEEVEEKPRKRNPMIADEAEESDCNEEGEENQEMEKNEETGNDDVEQDDDDNDSSDEESEESSEEEEPQRKQKKGRILKAFEDSDEEDRKEITVRIDSVEEKNEVNNSMDKSANSDIKVGGNMSNLIKDTQDDELQLAQLHKSLSEDIFASQGSSVKENNIEINKSNNSATEDKDLGTQTFSIMDSQKDMGELPMPDNIEVNNTQKSLNYDEGNLDHVIPMCSGSFSQNLVTSQYPASQSIGDDVLALCTGKFFENQFVSQTNGINTEKNSINDNRAEGVNNIYKIDEVSVINVKIDETKDNNKEIAVETNEAQNEINTATAATIHNTQTKESVKLPVEDNIFISSILEELGDPELDKPKEQIYFENNKENKSLNANSQYKKKFVIDSDDEESETAEKQKKKKFRKKKMEKRALQISDDEEDDEEDNDDDGGEAVQEFMSDGEDPDRLVEYDSEENEVIIEPADRKKKRKTTEFFEQEAELTSEDEWVGSGDEDEAGLDRMEREAGDDDTFHQGKLQSELERIHMRDVLDQDKREVRLIQELLFEDGDLGGGGRQRKFRWNNTDGDGDDAANPYKDLADTQEEDLESEEQYRKQRHEREMFLKQMKNEEDDLLDIDISASMVKPNLSSRSINTSATEMADSPAPEKKTAKDIPSPQKPFILFKQNYHGSLLTRGSGALARLAALAIPIAADDDAPKPGSLAPSSKRNFVFATLTQKEEETKVTKRKAETINIGTPKLVKKMKREDKQNNRKSSLLDHIV